MSTKVTAPVGYKPIEGTCALPEKIVNKKKNEIWLIHAPLDFPETEVEKIKVDLKNGKYTSELIIGEKKYIVREGDSEAVCQMFYCYKDDKKGIIPGKPFARELIIELATEPESFFSKEDGHGKSLPPVEQLTGLKLRYFPPGATPAIPAIPASPVKHSSKKEDKSEKKSSKKSPKKSEKKEKKSSKK